MNSALFEVWTSELARFSDEQRAQLILNKDNIKEGYQRLLWDSNFHKSIVSSTASEKAVRTRFSCIRELLAANLMTIIS